MLVWILTAWTVAGFLLALVAGYLIYKFRGGYISMFTETILVLICGPAVWLIYLIIFIDNKRRIL